MHSFFAIRPKYKNLFEQLVAFELKNGSQHALVFDLTKIIDLDQVAELYKEIEYTTNYKSAKRVRMLAAKHFVLHTLLSVDESVNLSISHSHQRWMVLFSEQKSGIDLELVTDKALRVKHKFTDIQEQMLRPETIEKQTFFTILWTAKEAVYKALENQQGIQVSKIKLQHFTSLETCFELKLKVLDNVFLVRSVLMDGYSCSFVLT